MVLTVVLLAVVVTLITKWIWDRKKAQNLFREMGINGPQPSLLMGNMSEIMKKGRLPQLNDWSEKYGKVYGYYEGSQPIMVTSDTEMLKQILIKEFSKFADRPTGIFSKAPGDKHANMVFSNGETWKRLRSIASPTFSAKKMKEMSPLVNNCLTHFLDILDQRCDEGKPFDILGDYQRFTLDSIASCAFGIDSSCVKDDDSEFMKQARNVMRVQNQVPTRIKLLMLSRVISPTLFEVIRPFFSRPSNLSWFFDVVRTVIQQRQQEQNQNRVDFIQLMLNAKETNVNIGELAIEANDDATIDTNITEGKALNAHGKGMSPEEIEAQATTFLLAGYETTSIALSFMSYELALNPDVQEKLRQEIFEHFPNENVYADYITVQKLKYMDMVLQEVMRIHSPAASIQRQCIESCTIKGIHIPKGMAIVSQVETLHNDINQWGPEDPKLFIPERFLPERKSNRDSLAWMPFGAGPRNCVGLRFALLEVKIAMVRILKRYVIHQCKETEVPPVLQKVLIRGPVNGITLKLSRYFEE